MAAHIKVRRLQGAVFDCVNAISPQCMYVFSSSPRPNEKWKTTWNSSLSFKYDLYYKVLKII